MTAADLPLILAIDPQGAQAGRKRFYEEKLTTCLRDPGINTSLVAEWEGRAGGFLMGQLFFGEFGIPSSRAVLDVLAVHPDFRRSGMARELVEQYERNLGALRVEAIDTLVEWCRLDLLGFFRSLGFRPSPTVDLLWDIRKYPFAGMTGAFTIRRAEESDLAAVTAIDLQSNLVSRSAYLEAKFTAAAANPHSTMFLVAVAPVGAIIGYVVARCYGGEFGIDQWRGVVDSFGVEESSRHMGVGSALVSELQSQIRAQGIEQMETLCRWNDWELLQFFEYVGFRPSPRFNLEKRLSH